MSDCKMCGGAIRDRLDFGPQPLGNRFLRSRDEPQYLHPCRLGVCSTCGLLQLETPAPVAEMRPRFEWIRYNEPEHDIPTTAPLVAALPGIDASSTVGGLTRNDESMLRQLAALGLSKTWVADPRTDLGVESPLGGLESFQEAVNAETAERLAERHGRADVLVVRYLLEHAHDPLEFLRTARSMVRPNGYVLFAVPDTAKAQEQLDYTAVWEEHVLYLTAATLDRCLTMAGFEVVYLHRFPRSQADGLVAIGRRVEHAPAVPDTVPEVELDRASRFLREYPAARERIRGRIDELAHGRRIALFGAGHLSRAYIDLYGLADRVEFVADDNPVKQGLYMPGSRVPILPSSELAARVPGLCLMTVRTEVEAAVIARSSAYTTAGGVLASVFPDSEYAIDRIGSTSGGGRAA